MIRAVPPVVHLNGSSRESLLNSRFDAIDALNEAGDKLAKAGPNNRDYYPKGPEYCEQAMSQHDERIEALKSIIAALYEEIESIQS